MTNSTSVCAPKPFPEEMGIRFSHRVVRLQLQPDEADDAEDGIVAPELVKGTDKLLLRDNWGNRVWNARTDKPMHGSRTS